MDQEKAAAGKYRLIGISGSLRRGSYSTAVLQTIVEAMPEDVTMTTFDIGSLPHYNEDLDTGDGPASVLALKSAISHAHGVVIVTPEYNHSIPGVLKNALDWASRPSYKSCLANKPISIVTTGTGAIGGVRSQAHFHEVFLSTASRIVPGKQVVISFVDKKLTDGRLTEEVTKLFMLAKIDELLAEIALVHGWKPRKGKLGSRPGK